jgi:hypothetical protein
LKKGVKVRVKNRKVLKKRSLVANGKNIRLRNQNILRLLKISKILTSMRIMWKGSMPLYEGCVRLFVEKLTRTLKKLKDFKNG